MWNSVAPFFHMKETFTEYIKVITAWHEVPLPHFLFFFSWYDNFRYFLINFHVVSINCRKLHSGQDVCAPLAGFPVSMSCMHARSFWKFYESCLVFPMKITTNSSQELQPFFTKPLHITYYIRNYIDPNQDRCA